MNRKVSMMKSMVVAAALMAGVSGLAHADDSSMNRFTGASYAYFNGGQSGKPVFDNAPSAWRQSRPNGLPENQLQALSSEAPAYALSTPVFEKSPSAWRQANPNGLPENQLQALSSEAPAWHPPNQSATTALASTNAAVIAMSAAK
jgi:hypothetical protein